MDGVRQALAEPPYLPWFAAPDPTKNINMSGVSAISKD